jgi:8-oxo-dGTP pyrophosphatase MutT (NUDIX family)
MEQVISAGAVVFYQNNEELKFLVIKHLYGSHWGFPKGHQDIGETTLTTALREVYEEVGLEVQPVSNHCQTISYQVVDYITKRPALKTVYYYLCKSLSQDVKLQTSELEAYQWLSKAEVINILTHEKDQRMFETLCQELTK